MNHLQHHRYCRLAFIALAFLITSLPAAFADIQVTGCSGTPTRGWAGIATYFGSGLDSNMARIEPRANGQWITSVEKPGTYTALIEDGNGLGPALRPSVSITEDGPNRVDVTLPLQYDLLGGQPISGKHKEYGQTFVAEGTSLTGIAFRDAEDVLISMYEENALGKRVGKTVAADIFYPHGTLPTVPGKTYYLKFARKDGKPFSMYAVSGNRYAEGQAFADGTAQADFDLALRMQYDPSGQILHRKPRFSQVYKSAKVSYGQTFVAQGNGLAVIDVFPAYEDRPPFNPTIKVLEGGPEGVQVGPTFRGRVIALNPGDVPLVKGKTYYIEVSHPGGLKLYTEDDVCPDGRMYLDGRPVPGKDLAMILIEYEPDTVPPPSPDYVQHFPADSELRTTWSMPLSNDVVSVRVRRAVSQGDDRSEEGEVIEEIPVSAQGRMCIVDSGLRNGVGYVHSMRAVDAFGNESEPLQGGGTPYVGAPSIVPLINGDFEGPNDFLVPYGWAVKLIADEYPTLYLDNISEREGAGNTAGWQVCGKTDFAMYQKVPCVKGRRYEFSADTWCDEPWDNGNFNMATLVGIDPLGGTDPASKSVIWSAPQWKPELWRRQSVQATAESDSVTVYLRGFAQYYGERTMHARFDNAEITDITRIK